MLAHHMDMSFLQGHVVYDRANKLHVVATSCLSVWLLLSGLCARVCNVEVSKTVLG